MRRIIFALCLLATPLVARADPGTITAGLAWFVTEFGAYIAIVSAAVTAHGKRSGQRGAREPNEHAASQVEPTATSTEEPACHS